MTEVNFGDILQAAEEKYNIGVGSDKFKFNEGENRIRVLSASVPVPSTFPGNTSVQFATQVWDYGTNALKLAFLPTTIVKAIAKLQAKPEYAFTETPMPYDLLVDKEKTGPEIRDVKYTVQAARSNTPVPQEALDALVKEKPIEEIVALIQSKQTTPSTGTQPSTTSIPF